MKTEKSHTHTHTHSMNSNHGRNTQLGYINQNGLSVSSDFFPSRAFFPFVSLAHIGFLSAKLHTMHNANADSVVCSISNSLRVNTPATLFMRSKVLLKQPFFGQSNELSCPNKRANIVQIEFQQNTTMNTQCYEWERVFAPVCVCMWIDSKTVGDGGFGRNSTNEKRTTECNISIILIS